jgi:hypothetical protein
MCIQCLGHFLPQLLWRLRWEDHLSLRVLDKPGHYHKTP